MNLLNEILNSFFENATRLSADSVLGIILELQYQISQLPEQQTTSSGKCIQVDTQVYTMLGKLKLRSITDIEENYLCVAFGFASLNYSRSTAYLSYGGKRIAFWKQSGFLISD
jgi:hypothetical protein